MPIQKLPIFALSLLAILAVSDSSSSFAAERLELQCNAEGSADISMRARFEQRESGRRKFNTEFEAAPGTGFTAGQKMTVLVAGVKAGTVKLKTVLGGDVEGELELDDAAGPSDDEKPFPPDFPDVERNTKVVVKISSDNVLSCRLQ
jgi:hypothetical protein